MGLIVEMITTGITMMKRFAMVPLMAFLMMVINPATAQVDNLVPNGSFENSDLRKLKKQGELETYTEDWFRATEVPLDLFAEGMKSDKVNIPENIYGKEDASDGVCYAGLRAFSKDPKMKRTYYEVQLTTKMEKNQLYCVSFDISLSDLSRYAVNGVGAVLSDRKVEQGNTGLLVRKPDVRHKTDKVMSLTEGWETVCGTHIGTGQEEYIIIGGFHTDKDIEDEKIRKPSGVLGVQTGHAYYYLDNVMVKPIEAKSQCACSAADEVRTDLVFGAAAPSPEASADEVVAGSVVYYAFLKRRPTGAGEMAIKRLADVLKDNPSWKLRVVGHTDNDELNEGKINPRYRQLGYYRAEGVVKKFGDFGVAADRLIVDSMEADDPASTRDSEISRAKNRRVVFELVK
ncbi:MAG: hypothetical protein CL845_07060 [Crocinitomicaceae bacterium]|nr:hypothetical protein [Crocinitomicaceae bacterium]|tara:strand:- start:494 stop:1696 length:1203 start_codon:yes stop_codon:yes gene_type:complete